MKSFTMLEWGVVASLLISIGGFVFSAGYLYGQIQTHDVRLDKVEKRSDETALSIARIDANVLFLTELAKEKRAKE